MESDESSFLMKSMVDDSSSCMCGYLDRPMSVRMFHCAFG